MFDIALEGDTKALLKKAQNFSDIDKRGLNDTLSEDVRESTLERFKTGVDPEGKKWKSSIRVDTEGGKTLVDSAQLRNSIHSQADLSGFAVGTNVKSAATHQFGDSSRTIRARRKPMLTFRVNGKWVSKKEVKVNIPKRAFLGLSDDDQRQLQKTTEDFINREK